MKIAFLIFMINPLFKIIFPSQDIMISYFEQKSHINCKFIVTKRSIYSYIILE